MGMVLPHSALQTGQHSKWRTGQWQAKPSGREEAAPPAVCLQSTLATRCPGTLRDWSPTHSSRTRFRGFRKEGR